MTSSCNILVFYLLYNKKTKLFMLLFHILHKPVSCRADDLLGDAHDAADVVGFLAHLVEDEEEGVLYFCSCRSINEVAPKC